MLRNIKEILGYSIKAQDGLLGTVEDFFFDELSWIVKYMVVNTGSWLLGKRVVISPAGFRGKPDKTTQTFPVVLTCEMLKEWHSVDIVHTVSDEMKKNFSEYYAWPLYYPQTYPEMPPVSQTIASMEVVTEEEVSTHLRSMREVCGYAIHAKDGAIGHVQDFIIDDDVYHVTDIIVNTGTWLLGKQVRIPRTKAKEISWTENAVNINLSKEQIKDSYQYDSHAPINKTADGRVYDYEGKEKTSE